MAGLCATCSGQRWLALLRVRPFRAVGTVSYALYMFHVPVLRHAPRLWDTLGLAHADARSDLTWALLFALPALSWVALERPLLALGRSARPSAD